MYILGCVACFFNKGFCYLLQGGNWMELEMECHGQYYLGYKKLVGEENCSVLVSFLKFMNISGIGCLFIMPFFSPTKSK